MSELTTFADNSIKKKEFKVLESLRVFDPPTLLAAAIVGIGYGFASAVIGESRLPDNSVAGLVFRLGRTLGRKLREMIGGK